MVRVIIAVRELGRTKMDYSLPFDLPQLPAVGDYISVHRPDRPQPFSEDLIVRHIWWRLECPETRGVVTDGAPKVGKVGEIFVECDPALGPYASDDWRKLMEGAIARGITVEVFALDRFSVREKDLEPPP